MVAFRAAIAASAVAVSGGTSTHREYTKRAGVDCYEGAGGTVIDAWNKPAGNYTVADCQALCDATSKCVAVTHDYGSGMGSCWRLSGVEVSRCDRSDASWDTYIVGKADLGELLQENVDAVVARLQQYWPNLTISVAWQDAHHDVAVASGSVFGRPATPEDTFLYGSGTKPFTSVAVLRLIDSGRIKVNDKASSFIDPYLQAHGKPTLAHYFGDAVSNATVLDLVRMTAGIRDFEDDYSFDTWVLGNGSKFWDYPYDSMNYAVSPVNAKGGPPLYFSPGTGMAYSSTSYEVAGLLLAAVLQPKGEWYDFDLASALFANRSIYPSMHFPPYGRNDARRKLNQYLTVPGFSVADTWPKTMIYDQDPSILGWTCGNLIASPRDVAKFFRHVLDENVAHSDADPMISDESRARMWHYIKATAGWEAGFLTYGAGLMEMSYGASKGSVYVKGHEGDTYGFISSQGYVPELHGTFSIVTNVDNDYPKSLMACYAMQTAKQVIVGTNRSLGCTLPATEVLV